MKRREFLKVTGAGLAASTAVAAPAIAQSSPEVRWRLAASWPKALDTLYGGCEYFCKRVAEATDNKFQIQPFASGEIVPGLQVLDAVSNGTVEMGNTALYYYWGKNPAFTFGTSLPFGLNTRAHISWLLFGGGTEMLNDLLKEYNTVGIPTGSTGAQMGGWFRKEIKSMEDFRGLKFRVGGFAGTIIAKVGGVPQQIAGGDIYPALEKGTIDAAEWVGPYDDEKLGFVKVAKLLLLSGLVGRHRPGPQRHKSRQVERAAEALSGRGRDGLTRYLHLGHRQIRLRQPVCVEAPAGGRCGPEAVPAGSPGGLLQRRQRDLRRSQQDQSALQQDVHQPVGIQERVARLDAGRRAQLRQLHDADADTDVRR
ncbi:TRAP-type C4-dicarboxylate transport system substrate-binding protein [Bradyrhizobium sp. i1.3.1]